METIWFCLVALMIVVYVVLDGFDLGAGIVRPFVARSEKQRRQVLGAIGPVWDGNEVWLLAGGGVLYFAFPPLYAAGFSGFYLPLTIVLWLIILRAISIEFRNHIDSPVWKPVWDVGFTASSALLAIFFGAALGNVVRGVPLDGTGFFFLPLWTTFTTGGEVGILDWYTVVIGIAAFLALAMHGALWVALKTEGDVEARARALANRIWPAVALSTALITVLSFRVQPHLGESFRERPWGYVFPLIALIGLMGARGMNSPRLARSAFLSSAVYLAGMLAGVAFGLFPYVLPSNTDPALALTVHNSAAAPYGLRVGLYWFIPGIILATGYFVYLYRHFAGKVMVEEEGY